MLDFMSMLDVSWYGHQLVRLAKGQATRPQMSAWTSVLKTFGTMGVNAFRRQRA